MGNFNFYINVDQCLNMSNFDIFFYKLQSEDKFHLSNVRLSGKDGRTDYEMGQESLDTAFHDIRSYMDKHPFLLSTYRMVFGLRQVRRPETMRKEWKETVLYKLLWIYYSLRNNKIFIQSRDQIDKNVSVIVLYDTDLTHDTRKISLTYDQSEDVICLLRALGMSFEERVPEEQVYQWLSELNLNEYDQITQMFLKSYLENYKYIQFTDNDSAETFVEQSSSEEALTYNAARSLIEHTENLIGNYCIFQKEIDQNSMSERLLSFLSIVDYITADLKSLSSEEADSSSSLKNQSLRNWEESINDKGIKLRYGKMMDTYRKTLENAKQKLETVQAERETGETAPEYEEPDEISIEESKTFTGQEIYEGNFREKLKIFISGVTQRQTAAENWKQTYASLKQILNGLDEDMEKYARELDQAYKKKIKVRKEEGKQQKHNSIYTLQSVGNALAEAERKKKELLEKLKEPRMNPNLRFADQLNMERSLEKCNNQIGFFLDCQKMITPIRFLLLIAIVGGGILLHYILLQSFAASDSIMAFAFLGYVMAAAILMLLCYNAPARYFKEKMQDCLESLQKDVHRFIQGYFDEMTAFEEYINLMNRLDALNEYITDMRKVRDTAELQYCESLWHKTQIIDHLRKSSYFSDLVQDLPHDVKMAVTDCECPINLDQDVVHNEIYWPQRKLKEEMA